MAIRLRVVGRHWVAICAARSVERIGDVYLDDGQHHALTSKFAQDFNSEGLWPHPEDDRDNAERSVEESNNANRDEWDVTFGSANTQHRSPDMKPSRATPREFVEFPDGRRLYKPPPGSKGSNAYAKAKRKYGAVAPEST